MKPEEVQTLTENAITSELYGCDCSISNVFLYQEKYKITSHEKHSILFRYYNTTENHTGWAFPIPLKSSSPDYLKTALEEIIKSQKHEFCYISENQKKLIDDTLAANFPEYKVEWQTFRGDSDYLYLQSDLANLPGKPYQKKRNHISRFNRTYENRWEFKMFPKDNIKKDILGRPVVSTFFVFVK